MNPINQEELISENYAGSEGEDKSQIFTLIIIKEKNKVNINIYPFGKRSEQWKIDFEKVEKEEAPDNDLQF